MVSKSVVPDLGKPIRKIGLGSLSGCFKVGHFSILDFLKNSFLIFISCKYLFLSKFFIFVFCDKRLAFLK